MLAHVEGDVAQRLHAAEGERDALGGEDHLAGAAPGPAIACGASTAFLALLPILLQRFHHAALFCNAAAAPAAGQVVASISLIVADTEPTRPSSNRTWVSMNCSALPA